MKGSRLGACRQAVRRVTTALAVPFLKSKNVKDKSSRDKYTIGDASHENTPNKTDEGKLAIEELAYIGSNLTRWVNASARNDARVTPVDGTTWGYLMGINSSLYGTTPKSASCNTSRHTGNLCKDYSIFQVSHQEAKVSPMVDYTRDGLISYKSPSQTGVKSSNTTKPLKCTPCNTSKHLGYICKDYTIFQVED
ncbi:hypothetical protein ScPMuIL_004996 [Solemya velum]